MAIARKVLKKKKKKSHHIFVSITHTQERKSKANILLLTKHRTIMLVGYCDLMDPRHRNHWLQHLLPEHRLCGLANSQQFTKGCKCVRWAPSVSLNACLHLSNHLSYHPKRHCCNICCACKAWPPSSPKQHGTWARQFLWGGRVGSHSLQRGFGWYPTTRVKSFF